MRRVRARREAVAALADAGADLNATDPDGATALALAVINGHAARGGCCSWRAAPIRTSRDRTGMTPLYAAVDLHTMQLGFGRPDPPPATIAGSVEMVKALLAHGANPNAPLTGAGAEAGVYGWRRQARQRRHAVHARGAGRRRAADEDPASRGRRSAPGAGQRQLAAAAGRGPGLPGTDRRHRGDGARRDRVQPRAGRRHQRGERRRRHRRARRGHDQLRRVAARPWARWRL